MSEKKPKTTGAELAKRLSEVEPEAQAAVLLHLLENNSTGFDDILANRDWIGGNSSKNGHGSGWSPELDP